MTRTQHRLTRLGLYSVLFAGALILYMLTLNPDVQPADSGEFQIAAITLGVAHPPGYPLFTMLGWLFAQMPFGSAFTRVSVLSAVVSAFTVLITARAAERISESAPTNAANAPGMLATTLGGIVGALTLATSTTFWAQSTTTNIRSLTAFFTALLILVAARTYADHQRGQVRMSSPVLFAFALGLGIGHHASLAFPGAVLGGLVLWIAVRHRLPWWGYAFALIAFALTQVVWLYLPWRDAAGARFAPGNLNTLSGVLYHILARGFAGDMFAFAAPEFLGDRIAILPALLTFQFSAPILALSALGCALLVWRRRPIGLALLGACILHLFVTLTYRAPQTVEYALPAWVTLCVMLGGGLGLVGAISRSITGQAVRIGATLGFVCLIGASILFVLHDAGARLPGYLALAQDRSTRALAAGALEQAAPNSVILAMWHQATPMWALQDVESVRRDVRVEYVYPRGAQPYAQTFAETARAYAVTATTYSTSLFEGEFAAQGLRAIPVAGLNMWRIELIDAATRAPETATHSRTFDHGRIAAGLLHAPIEPARAGSVLYLDAFWQITGEARAGESLTFRIMRHDGRLAANADVQVSADSTPHYRRLTLALPPDLLPGEYLVLVGAYRATEQGFAHWPADDGSDFATFRLRANGAPVVVRVLPSNEPPATRRPLTRLRLPFAPLPSTPQLVGVDYDTSIPGRLRIHTHWQLAESEATIEVRSVEGHSVSPAQRLPPATQLIAAEYLTLRFDAPQWKPLRVYLRSAAGAGEELTLPDFEAGERYVPFGDQMTLIGVQSWRDGDQARIELRWLANRSITGDYIISTRLSSSGIVAIHDSVPALGAIPTLKWIRGAMVTDRHVLGVTGSSGELAGSVVVYDGFTRQPLPALDERDPKGVVFTLR
ncbi:MAG: DUF2723 domain-containing protein [Anaerolineae bacterium]|nr:DUF2723 domain-containing protein [Thermoflexales bacterium]MDW8407851.1 DUF2723 domain-containing protein [Anaerolineae bacterium]